MTSLSPPSSTPSSNTELTPRRRQAVLITMCLALVAVVASVSGLNVALTELSVELDASSSALLWVVNAYTLTMAALLLPVGEIGDRIGRRTILVAGLGVFAAANLASTLVDSAGQLIGLRVLAGVGAAMIMPATLSTLTSVFPDDERGRAVGIWAGFAGAGGIIGLFSSALIIDEAAWQWLFVLPAVAALLALVASVTLVPNTRSADNHRVDLIGGVLSAIAVGGIVLGIHEGPEIGWTAPVTIMGLVAGVVALGGFVTWSLRREHPLLDVRIFSNRALAAGSLSLLALFAMMFGAFLVVIQYLQAVLEFSAVRASAGLLPMAVAMMGLSPIAPRLADRFGLGRMLGLGSALMTVGFVWLAFADTNPSYLAILPGLVVTGVGTGLAMSPATTAITESLPADKQGVASALNDTVREFGSAIGVALIGSVLAAGYSGEIETTTATLPEELAEPVGEGIGQAMAVATQVGPEGQVIAVAARDAFLSGWSLAMIVAAAATAVSGVAVTAIFGRDGDRREPVPGTDADRTPVSLAA